MTGTINSDGTIGPVGGVPEKAQAAGQYHAKIFLVPKGKGVSHRAALPKASTRPNNLSDLSVSTKTTFRLY